MGSLSEIQRQAIMARLRSEFAQDNILVPDESVFHDQAAPLLELTAPDAARDFSLLCQEAAYVKPLVLTIRTLTDIKVWAVAFERVLFATPECPGVRLRWHRSFCRGRVLAQPAATLR